MPAALPPPLPRDIASLPHFRTVMFRHILVYELRAAGTAVDLGAGACWFSVLARDLGLRVTAVDARTDRLPREELRQGITFVRDDVRTFPLDGFDYVFVLGLLYHLPLADQAALLDRARGARAVVLDTQIHVPELIRAEPEPWETDVRCFDGYFGVEFPERDTLQASWGNPTSIWLTEPSLMRLAADRGYRSVTPVGPVHPTVYGGRRFYVLRP